MLNSCLQANFSFSPTFSAFSFSSEIEQKNKEIIQTKYQQYPYVFMKNKPRKVIFTLRFDFKQLTRFHSISSGQIF